MSKNFNSKFGIGDPVTLKLGSQEGVAGHVRAVTFTNCKVRYAVKTEDSNTTVHNVDSIFVIDRNGAKVDFGSDNYS